MSDIQYNTYTISGLREHFKDHTYQDFVDNREYVSVIGKVSNIRKLSRTSTIVLENDGKSVYVIAGYTLYDFEIEVGMELMIDGALFKAKDGTSISAHKVSLYGNH